MTSTAVTPSNAAQAAYSSSGATTKNSSTSSTSANQLSLNQGLTSLASNFQGFLTLLTTQLKNQDPTQPLDTNQFTQQITQMTGVEQQLLSNNLLQQLVAEQTGVGAAASLIGDKVTATDASTGAPITGTVTAVSQVNNQTVLTVGSKKVPVTALTSVTTNAQSLSALVGG